MVILDRFNLIFKTELLIVFGISFGSILFGGYCTDSQCTASGMQAGCDAATGCTSVEDCFWTISEGAPSDQYTCCSSYGSGGALQQYYFDTDGDGFGGEFAGWYCTNNSSKDSYVTTQTDIDDNCKCSTNSDSYDAGSNPIPCHDDCGLCSYDAAGAALTTRNDYRLCTDASTTDGCNDATNVGPDGVYSDCTGVCSGGRLYYEQFANVDTDNFGGTTQGYHCMTDVNIALASSSGWIGNGGDLDDQNVQNLLSLDEHGQRSIMRAYYRGFTDQLIETLRRLGAP